MSVALITGGSAGLGRELTHALADDGWSVVTDAREGSLLARMAAETVLTVPGDVADAGHRAELAAAVARLGRLDLLVHNASTLGPLPMRPLRELSPRELYDTFAVNTQAPLALTQLLLPRLKADDGILVSMSSDAAVEHYETWGAYGATKAALDHLTLTWAAEEGLTAYAVDPSDMRTAMHQAAFPDEDISDRPLPRAVVPHLLELIAQRPRSGRYRAADVPLRVGA